MNPSPDEAFLALVPNPLVVAEPGEGDRLVLVRPKILSRRWAWLLGWMKRPAYRVRLDDRGTALWRTLDGQRTVAQVADAMARAYPGDAHTPERTARFLQELALGRFIELRPGLS